MLDRLTRALNVLTVGAVVATLAVATGCDYGKQSPTAPAPKSKSGPTSRADSGDTSNPITGPIDKAKWTAVKEHLKNMAMALKMYAVQHGKLPEELRAGMDASEFGPLVDYSTDDLSQLDDFRVSDFVLEEVDLRKKTYVIRATSSTASGPKGTATVDQTGRPKGP